jgi:hypothetical protein
MKARSGDLLGADKEAGSDQVPGRMLAAPQRSGSRLSDVNAAISGSILAEPKASLVTRIALPFGTTRR